MPRCLMPSILLLSTLLPAASASESVDRETWVSHMAVVLPDFFCREEAWFRQCFEVSIDQCRQVAGDTTRACLDNFTATLPELIALPDEGRQWGHQIGSCAGSDYERKLIAQRISSNLCNDASQW